MEELKSSTKSKETPKRLFWSAIFLSISCWVVLFSPPAIYFAVTVFFILMALNEYVTLAQKKDIRLNRFLMLTLGFAVPWANASQVVPIFLVVTLFTLFFSKVQKDRLPEGLVASAVGLLGIVWIGWLFSYAIDLRDIPQGPRWVFYAILVTKMGDAGAYFIGKKWGNTKFVPHISPHKTWEGSLGQLGTSILISCLSRFYLDVAWHHLLWLGVLIGIVSQVGDIVESVVKRNLGAKDSGTIPGLGGFLDILDSLLFTLPLVYYYATRL